MIVVMSGHCGANNYYSNNIQYLKYHNMYTIYNYLYSN